jgi:hypothetical protein
MNKVLLAIILLIVVGLIHATSKKPSSSKTTDTSRFNPVPSKTELKQLKKEEKKIQQLLKRDEPSRAKAGIYFLYNN